MMKDLYQSADWKAEKHVPVIECADTLKKGEAVTVTVSVGKQIAHPNTAAHHIAAVELYFLPNGEKFPYQIGRCEFSSHGASIQGPDTSTVFTQPVAVFSLKTEKSGVLLAGGYCNIHGAWENAKEITVV
ncbi:MAG: class II SORL domain-containing protein [Candidatus Omnitrophica bacterium]|nr:class II SORL domain-containing protein [Candidatus Omnitrophota bacterium]